MAPAVHQKCIQIHQDGLAEVAINQALQVAALDGWQLVAACTYPILSFQDPGGIYLFFTK